MDQDNNDYGKYINDVLGVHQILIEPHELLRFKPIKIYIWVENLKMFSSEDLELLNKMIAAMKIDLSCISISDLSQKNDFVSSSSYNQVEQIHFDMVQNPSPSFFQTYSPQVIHINKDLKMKAWTFLQHIMALYNKNSSTKDHNN